MSVSQENDESADVRYGDEAVPGVTQRHSHIHAEPLAQSLHRSVSHSESQSHSDSETYHYSYSHSYSHDRTGGHQPTHTPHGDAQRQALTRVAFLLIAEGGLERFRTREVAKRAGVNIATLHYYFPSKEDLIRSVVDYLSNEFATRQAPYVGATSEPLIEIRRELNDTLYQLREFPEIFLALFELFTRAAHDPAIRALMQEMDTHWHAHVVANMREGVRQGVIRADLDPDVAAWGLIAMIKGCVMELTLHADGFPIERTKDEIERWFTGCAPQL